MIAVSVFKLSDQCRFECLESSVVFLLPGWVALFWLYCEVGLSLVHLWSCPGMSVARLAAHVTATRLRRQDLYFIMVTAPRTLQANFNLRDDKSGGRVSKNKLNISSITRMFYDSPLRPCWWCSIVKRRWCCGWSWRPPALSIWRGRRWTHSSRRRRRPDGFLYTCHAGHCGWSRWKLEVEEEGRRMNGGSWVGLCVSSLLSPISVWQHESIQYFFAVCAPPSTPSLHTGDKTPQTHGGGDNQGWGFHSSNQWERRAAAATSLAGPAGRGVRSCTATSGWQPGGSKQKVTEAFNATRRRSWGGQWQINTQMHAGYYQPQWCFYSSISHWFV